MSALIVLDGPAAGQRLEVDAEVTLGRETHEFLQHDNEVSRRHAAVRPVEEGLEIEDLGSSNGTFVNELRVTGVTPIRPGDTIRLGQTALEVEATPATAATTIREVPEAAPATEPPPVEAPEATAPIGADPGPGPVPAGPPPLGPPPLGPPPLGPPLTGPPPTGPPPTGPPPLGPSQHAPPGMATGRRPGIVTAAAVVLIVAGFLGVGLAIWRAFVWLDLFNAVRNIEEILGFSTGARTSLMVLLGFLFVGLIGGATAIVGGFRLLALSRAGVVAGSTGAIMMLVGWAAFLVWGLARDVGLETIDWIAGLGSVAGAGIGLGLLLGARRHVAAPRSTPWAA